MKSLFLLFVCLLFVFTADVFAITDEEIFRNFEFSFVNPGARSGAMGGAFVGLADDATAAEANPAGLTILTKPEVSVEYRHINNDGSRLDSFNTVTDSTAGISVLSTNDLKDLDQPSFVAVVYPFKKSTFAFSRQEFTETKAGLTEGTLANIGGQDLFFETIANQDQKIDNYNFSFATKVTDHFSAGATLRISTLDWTVNSQNTALIGDQLFLLFKTELDDTDTSFAWNAGGLYTANHFSVGAVYKKNARFEVTETESGLVSNKPGPFTNVLKVPDTFATGASVKPNDNITLVADVVWIQYSDLTTDIEVGRNLLTNSLTSEDISYKINNKWDFHTGAEFVVFVGKVPAALRIGYYHKGSSSLIVDATPGLGSSGTELFHRLYPERPAEHHFTMGNGFVFGDHFQIDWALDLANISDSFVLSSVVRF